MKMKNSNKILIAAGAIPFVVVISAIIAIRVFFLNDIVKVIETPSFSSGKQSSKIVKAEGFDEISVVGPWTLHVYQGIGYNTEISAPKNIIDKIVAEKRGDKLSIVEGPGPADLMNNVRLEATITLPMLTKLDLNGVINLDLYEINGDNLSINMQGVTRIAGYDGKVKDLSLSGKGVLTIDLSGLSATNANVNYDGTYMINLKMNGGRLTGGLGGVGRLNYGGDVSSNEIQLKNPASGMVHVD